MMSNEVNRQPTGAEVEQIHRKIARRLGDSSLPTLPQVAIEVLNLIDKPNSGIRDFADLIKTDQALTGRMLRLANSAAYAQRGEVTNLQRAIVLLGIERTKAMALGFHLSETMKGCPSTGVLWTHALMRAWLAFHIVERFNHSLTGQMFIVGLMLDAGIGVMPMLVGEDYCNVVDVTSDPVALLRAERQWFEFTHVDVGIVMTSKMWHFPESLSKPIARHHQPVGTCDRKNADSLIQCVAHFVGTLPLIDPGIAKPDGRMEGLARSLFGLKKDELRAVIKDAAADYESTKQMFGKLIDPSISVQSIVDAANEQLGVEPETEEQDLDGCALTFEGNSTTLELEGKTNKRIAAFIVDAEGNRVLSITIDPASQSPEQIREELMLDTHDPEQAEKILRIIQQLAA